MSRHDYSYETVEAMETHFTNILSTVENMEFSLNMSNLPFDVTSISLGINTELEITIAQNNMYEAFKANQMQYKTAVEDMFAADMTAYDSLQNNVLQNLNMLNEKLNTLVETASDEVFVSGKSSISSSLGEKIIQIELAYQSDDYFTINSDGTYDYDWDNIVELMKKKNSDMTDTDYRILEKVFISFVNEDGTVDTEKLLKALNDGMPSSESDVNIYKKKIKKILSLNGISSSTTLNNVLNSYINHWDYWDEYANMKNKYGDTYSEATVERIASLCAGGLDQSGKITIATDEDMKVYMEKSGGKYTIDRTEYTNALGFKNVEGEQMSNYSSSKNSDGSTSVSFTLLNSRKKAISVKVYDAEGNVINNESLDYYHSPDSISGVFKTFGSETVDIIKGDWDKIECSSQDFSFTVPEGGRIEITANDSIAESTSVTDQKDLVKSVIKLSGYDDAVEETLDAVLPSGVSDVAGIGVDVVKDTVIDASTGEKVTFSSVTETTADTTFDATAEILMDATGLPASKAINVILKSNRYGEETILNNQSKEFTKDSGVLIMSY